MRLAKIKKQGLVWFYGMSTSVGYLMPNPFLCKSVLFQTIQLSMSAQFVKNISISNYSSSYIQQFSVSTVPAVRVFANGPGDLGSIPGRVIPKTLKMELDTTLLNTQHYKVRFKGKVEQSREWSSALPYTLV